MKTPEVFTAKEMDIIRTCLLIAVSKDMEVGFTCGELRDVFQKVKREELRLALESYKGA